MTLSEMKNTVTGRWTREGKTALLVNPDPATCGRGWEKGFGYQYSLTGDHLSMIKFDVNDDGGYATVREAMRKRVQTAGKVIKDRLLSTTRTCHLQADVPHPANGQLMLSGKATERLRSSNTRSKRFCSQ